MSWLFSRALVEAYSAATCLNGEPCAPSSGTPTPQAYSSHGKMTDFSRVSRFGMTFRPLTADRGEELLTSYLAAFHAKTSPQPERAQELTESDQECGEKWQRSFTKYDQDSCSWKTHQCSLLGDLEPFSETWPRLGLMRDGECWEQQTLAHRINETESGLWPSPNSRDWKDSGASQGKRKSPNLGTVVHWATPVSDDTSYRKNKYAQGGTALSTQAGGKLNPTWVEWLMGWPLGWTDLKPLEMDKYHLWQQQHGKI